MSGMTDAPRIFRPSREHVIAIAMMTGIALIGILWAPLKLGWVLIFPIFALVWIFNAKTTISDSGISINYLLRKNVSLAWDQLKGVSFKGSKALATTVDGREYPMPGITFNTLPDLAEASRGRIADVITQAAESSDGKYEVIDKEGYSVLLDQDEYEEYLKEHPDMPGPRPADNPADDPANSQN